MIIITITKFIINFILFNLVTLLCTVPIAILGLIKILIPCKFGKYCCSIGANSLMYMWCAGLALVLRLTHQVNWQVSGINSLSKKQWYILIANHKSWLDIIVLCILFRKHIPMNKYFLKHELIWIPFIGLACLALDMPFMRRYSRSYLLKHPHKRGKDLATTEQSCEKFKLMPTTVVNFVEGSRFTPTKNSALNSPYTYLLPPKAAGVAFAINLLSEQCHHILNVTIDYPHNEAQPFIDLLCGKIRTIVVEVETIIITPMLRGNYRQDKKYKRQFHLWLKTLWEQKDQQLSKIKKKNQYMR